MARSRRFGRFLRTQPRDHLIRIGTDYGGWTIPDGLLGADAVCYCAGVGFDISFDIGLIGHLGCEVHAFDPTPSAARFVASEAAGEPRFHFHDVGLWSSDRVMSFYEPIVGDQNFSVTDVQRTGRSIEARFRSLNSLMAELEHDHLDLLKLDIEAAEYEVIESLVEEQIPVAILCVEFHKTPGIGQMKRATATLKGAGFIPIHREGFDVTFVAS